MATRAFLIRESFHAKIVAATDLADTKVLRSPRFQVDAADLPVVAVYAHGDRPVDPEAISDRRHDRVYTVAVEINAVGRIEEDATDVLATAVRKAILADGTLGGLCSYITWASQEWGSKETQVAESATLLLFSCHYMWSPEW